MPRFDYDGFYLSKEDLLSARQKNDIASGRVTEMWSDTFGKWMDVKDHPYWSKFIRRPSSYYENDDKENGEHSLHDLPNGPGGSLVHFK